MKWPIPLRVIAGLIMMAGGVLWFLPILGIWMFPLGLLLIGTCFPFTKRKVVNWIQRIEAEMSVEAKRLQ